MKLKYFLKSIALAIALLFLHLTLVAQETTINKETVTNWFERNGLWVAAGAFVLLLIILFSGKRRSRSRKTTTVVKDQQGQVKSVTTTEVVE